MQTINNFSPTTFFSRFPVIIRDGKKNIFYYHSNEKGSITFNLPQGKFYSENPILKKSIFIPYPLIELPDYVCETMIPKNFLVKVGSNENKASIDLGRNKISVDEKIFNHEFAPLKVFVLGHEVGHHIFYKNPSTDEQNCDRFSYNCGMLSGYNPSQFEVSKEIVFEKNPERRKCLSQDIDRYGIRR